MSHPTMEILAAQLARLERANRRWRRLATLALLGLAVVVLTGQAPSKPLLLEAEQLIIRDASGRVRVAIKPLADGATVLTFRDQMERDRLALGVLDDGTPVISLYDEHRRRRLAFGVLGDSPALHLYGKDGAPRARLALDEHEAPRLSAVDPQGTPLLEVPEGAKP